MSVNSTLPPLPGRSPEIFAFHSELDLRGIWDLVRQRWWALFAGLLLGLAVGMAYLWQATPVYRADALVQVETEKGTLGLPLGELAEMMGAEVSVSAEMEILKSRMVLGQVVRELSLDLVVTPRYFPFIGRGKARRSQAAGQPAGAFLGLDRYAWGGEQIEISSLEVPEERAGVVLRLVCGDAPEAFRVENGRSGEALLQGVVGTAAERDGYSIFVRRLVCRPGTEFQLVRRNPVQAAQEIQRGLMVTEQGRASGILRVAYESSDPQLAAMTVNQVVQHYLRQNVERRSEEAQRRLEFLEQQLPRLRESLVISENELNRYRQERGAVDLTKETEILLEESVGLERARGELEQERSELMQRFTVEHPLVKSLDGKLSLLERQRSSLNSKVQKLPSTQQELLRLSREVKVNTELYTALLNSSQELQIAKAGTIGNVRIIDSAVTPRSPVRPRPGSVLQISSFVGLFLSMMILLVIQLLRRAVEDPAVLERALGIPVYATIPFSPAQRKLMGRRRDSGSRLLAETDRDDPAIEALRSLRTSLHFAQIDARNNIIVFTGPAPNIGKTFVSANFAAVLAMAGKRAVLMDADLRRGRVPDYFNLRAGAGFSDFVVDRATLADIVQDTEVENLKVITAGQRPPNPAELLLHPRTPELLQSLSQSFDYVILDTPPVLAVTDAAIIGRHAACCLFVVKSGAHPLPQIEEALGRLRHAGVETKGTVFNQMRRSSRYGYTYGYGYRYKASR